jgi:hypothetical protein
VQNGIYLPPNQLLIPLFASFVFFSTVLSKLSIACFDWLRASSNLVPASALRLESLASASLTALPSLASYSRVLDLASLVYVFQYCSGRQLIVTYSFIELGTCLSAPLFTCLLCFLARSRKFRLHLVRYASSIV